MLGSELVAQYLDRLTQLIGRSGLSGGDERLPQALADHSHIPT